MWLIKSWSQQYIRYLYVYVPDGLWFDASESSTARASWLALSIWKCRLCLRYFLIVVYRDSADYENVLSHSDGLSELSNHSNEISVSSSQSPLARVSSFSLTGSGVVVRRLLTRPLLFPSTVIFVLYKSPSSQWGTAWATRSIFTSKRTLSTHSALLAEGSSLLDHRQFLLLWLYMIGSWIQDGELWEQLKKGLPPTQPKYWQVSQRWFAVAREMTTYAAVVSPCSSKAQGSEMLDLQELREHNN